MELSRAENKVKVSDPITRWDIDILEWWDSKMLEDAVRLTRRSFKRETAQNSKAEKRRPEG